MEVYPAPARRETTVRRSTLPTGSSPAPAHSQAFQQAERTPSRPTFPRRRSSCLSGGLRRRAVHRFFLPPGGASWPFSGLPAGVKRPCRHSCRRPWEGSSTVWKPPSVPSTTYDELLDALTTVRYPQARMDVRAGLHCRRSPPPFRPYLHLLGGRRMPHFLKIAPSPAPLAGHLWIRRCLCSMAEAQLCRR